MNEWQSPTNPNATHAEMEKKRAAATEKERGGVWGRWRVAVHGGEGVWPVVEREKRWMRERTEWRWKRKRSWQGQSGDEKESVWWFLKILFSFSWFHLCGCIYRQNLDAVGELLKHRNIALDNGSTLAIEDKKKIRNSEELRNQWSHILYQWGYPLPQAPALIAFTYCFELKQCSI